MTYDITSQGDIIDKAYIDFIFADPNDQAHAWAINQATLKSNNRGIRTHEQTREAGTDKEPYGSKNTNSTE